MRDTPLSFTIVTPVLDGWPLVRAAVASVASQQARGITVRHIVQVSSRSTDPSENWLRTQPTLDVRTDPDTGLYDAIARGFSSSSSDILAWLNADEQMLPGALEVVAEEFRRHPETDVVFGDYLLLDAAERPTAARREIPANAWLLRNGVNSILSCATFFRRRVWEKLGGFDLSYTLLADKNFYLRALAAGFRFRHLRAYLGAYGNTGDNATLRDPAKARAEQARLRAEAGAAPLPVRLFARGLRCAMKLAHGCYGSRTVETRLFGPAGGSAPFRARLGTRWRDPVPSARDAPSGVRESESPKVQSPSRRIVPSLSRRVAFFLLGLACVGLRAVRPIRMGRARDRKTAPVLLLEPFGLGDAIALQPLVRALCGDGRRVTVCTRAAWFPVFPPHENLRLVETIPPWADRDEGKKYRGLFGRMRPFLRALRAEARGCVCIDPRGDVRSILSLYLAGAARVETLTHYYTANDCLVLPGAAHRHAIDRTVPRWKVNLAFQVPSPKSKVPSPKSKVPSPKFQVPSPKSKVPSPKSQVETGKVEKWKTGERARCDSNGPDLRFLIPPDVVPAPKRIALLPETPWIGKRWFDEAWAELADALAARGFEPVFLRGPKTTEEESQVPSSKSHVQTGKLENWQTGEPGRFGVCRNVPDWVAALAACSSVVAVNTGPMHIASALGKPVVLLEGPSRQPLWEPPCERHVIVSHQDEVSCAPCHQVGDCLRCGRRCMALVRPDEVLSALRRLGVL